MISPWLLSVVRCPICVTRQAAGDAGRLGRDSAMLTCADCGASYPIHDGYLDLRPPRRLTGKETVYTDAAADLDDPVIRRPVLSAGVRLRVLRRLLRPRRTDAMLDIGCGNGKFAVWNRRSVREMVGLDPAARFAPEALRDVDLVQGDARALPFAPGTFDAAYTVDMFEHLDLGGVRAHLAETRRILRGTGAYFCFSNTRERSWLNTFIDPGRRAAELLHRAGVVDRTRDHLRKGDHVKAVETTDALRDEFDHAGLRITTLWFLNPLLATYIETLGFAIAERMMIKRVASRSDRNHEDGEGLSGLQQRRECIGGAGFSLPSGSCRLKPAPPVSVRDAAGNRRVVRLALDAATALLMADVILFRRIRTGPFFLIARPARPS